MNRPTCISAVTNMHLNRNQPVAEPLPTCISAVRPTCISAVSHGSVAVAGGYSGCLAASRFLQVVYQGAAQVVGAASPRSLPKAVGVLEPKEKPALVMEHSHES
jgi:hypothetical protein